MPVKSICGRRPIVHLALLTAIIAGLLFAAGVVDAAFAQASPFGAPRAPAPVGGVLGWIFAKQAEFYRQFSGLIRAAKADGSAVWSLVGLSFLYGIFHAAGPGHGKAVISSYIVANDETWTRGVVLSFASALLQALVAVLVVGIAAVLLSASATTMGRAVNAIEIVSYSLIILIGLRLLWVKGRAFLSLLRTLHRPAPLSAAATPQPHDHAHHHHHGHDHAHHAHGDAHHHEHSHYDASAWGHAHAPEPQELAGPGGWKRGLSPIVAIASPAVAARAWAKHIADARSGYGMLAMRAIEVGAAVVIIAFGTLLLTGYMVTERMVGI